MYLDRWQQHALLEYLGRLAVGAPRNGAANVCLVRDRAGEPY